MLITRNVYRWCTAYCANSCGARLSTRNLYTWGSKSLQWDYIEPSPCCPYDESMRWTRASSQRSRTLKHAQWATRYGLSTLVAGNGDFVSRKATFYPETGDFVARHATLPPFSATKSPVSGYKVARFRWQSRRFRQQDCVDRLLRVQSDNGFR